MIKKFHFVFLETELDILNLLCLVSYNTLANILDYIQLAMDILRITSKISTKLKYKTEISWVLKFPVEGSFEWILRNKIPINS